MESNRTFFDARNRSTLEELLRKAASGSASHQADTKCAAQQSLNGRSGCSRGHSVAVMQLKARVTSGRSPAVARFVLILRDQSGEG